MLQILRSFGADGGAEDLASQIVVLYTDGDTAPRGWSQKDGLRKTLRQAVRGMAHEHGLSNLKDLPIAVEEFALKHFVAG